jgi:hypothetical protein
LTTLRSGSGLTFRRLMLSYSVRIAGMLIRPFSLLRDELGRAQEILDRATPVVAGKPMIGMVLLGSHVC